MDTAIELSRAALGTAIELALPVLLVLLVVGLIVSVFQAMTQVHDQTLSSIPKILAGAAVLLRDGHADIVRQGHVEEQADSLGIAAIRRRWRPVAGHGGDGAVSQSA